MCVRASRGPGVTQQVQAAGVMKSKTSESFVATSESNGVKKDGADEVKQKQLKKGENRIGAAVKTAESLPRSRRLPFAASAAARMAAYFSYFFFLLTAGRHSFATANDNAGEIRSIMRTERDKVERPANLNKTQ